MTDGDRLVIRPTPMTLGGPLMALLFLGFGVAYGVTMLAQQPVAQLRETVTSSHFLLYAPLNLVLLAGAGLWYWANSRPIILDRGADALIGHSRPVTLSDVIAVVVTRTPSGDDDAFAVQLVLPDGKLPLQRPGWCVETDAQKADAAAWAVAEFLGVPVELASPAEPAGR